MSVWIDISEYSTKYGVSQSTLRRRIRSSTITFKMEKGKYLLQDSSDTIQAAPLYARLQQRAPRERPQIFDGTASMAPLHDPVGVFEVETLTKENRKLKEQVAELQMLVKALEAELRGP